MTTMPTFKLSWQTRLLLRWDRVKRALDIGAPAGPLMGGPDSNRRSSLMRPSLGPISRRPSLDGDPL